MEWSRIKNIIILILVTVNLFLLVLAVNQDLKSRQYRQEALSGAVEVLAQQGIAVDAATLPGESNLPGLTAERDRESERSMAEALLGTVVRTDDGSRVTYAGNQGEAWFRSNGSFSVTFQDGLWAGEQDEGVHAVQLLSGAGFPCVKTKLTRNGMPDKPAVELESDIVTLVTVCQMWEDIPLFSCQAVLRYENGTLTNITGQRLTGTPVENTSISEQMDIPTVLIRFLSAMREGGHVFTRIDGLRAGYRTSTSPGGVTELEPVWEATTDGGVFYIDGSTGALSQ